MKRISASTPFAYEKIANEGTDDLVVQIDEFARHAARVYVNTGDMDKAVEEGLRKMVEKFKRNIREGYIQIFTFLLNIRIYRELGKKAGNLADAKFKPWSYRQVLEKYAEILDRARKQSLRTAPLSKLRGLAQALRRATANENEGFQKAASEIVLPFQIGDRLDEIDALMEKIAIYKRRDIGVARYIMTQLRYVVALEPELKDILKQKIEKYFGVDPDKLQYVAIRNISIDTQLDRDIRELHHLFYELKELIQKKKEIQT